MWTVLGTLGIMLATIVTGLLVDRRWSLLPRREELLAAGQPRLLLPGHGPGESAGTALASSPGDLLKLRHRQHCPRCAAEMTAAADDHATYEQRDLLVLRFACPRCQTIKPIYVVETER